MTRRAAPSISRPLKSLRGTLAVLGAWALARSVPFEPASYSAWAGIFLALFAAVSLVRPQRWLEIPTRARAGALLLAAGATALTAILWPSAIERSSRPRHRIDDFLPQYPMCPATFVSPFDVRIVDEGCGVLRLSTETRILGNDAAARRTFARYWRLVYPGSAVIRRVWLDAIVARAQPG